MNYKDYVNLKLNNSSKDELTNFSIQSNFAKSTLGYIPRDTDNIDTKQKSDREITTNTAKSSSFDNIPKVGKINNGLGNIAKDSVKSLSKQQTQQSKESEFGAKKSSSTATLSSSSSNSSKGNNQAGTSSSASSPTSSSTSPTSSKSVSSPKSTQNQTSEKKIVKNYYGQDVEFEKRDNKWYRSGTNEEVQKTGKWKSYFDEKSGVKNVRNTKSTTQPKKSKPTKSEYNPNGNVSYGDVEIQNEGQNSQTVQKYMDNLGNVVETTPDEAKARGLRTVDQVKNQFAQNRTKTEANKNEGKLARFYGSSPGYLKSLLDRGVITKAEYDKIVSHNKETAAVVNSLPSLHAG